MLLETIHISKKFGGHKALDDVNVAFKAGTIHSLVGENGAGKSTLIKIMTGVHQPSDGTIIFNGQSVTINQPKVALELGINVIHQDWQLVPYFTGLENLYLNKQYPTTPFGRIDRRTMRKQAKALQEKWKIDIPLDVPVYDMAPTERTMLEILRAMSQESRMLILDEPTASLTDKESELLFSLIEHLKQADVAVVYISHRLEEVTRISDEVTVLTGGKVTAHLEGNDITREKIIHYMTNGQEMKIYERANKQKVTDDTLLSVRKLMTKDERVVDVSFDVQRGEIVGMYGLAGAGRTESMEAIFGLREQSGGTIVYKNEHIEGATPERLIKEGVVLIPEDRHAEGVVMSNTIRHNMTLPILDDIAKGGVISAKAESKRVLAEMKRFNVRAVNENQIVSELSGGNQQKVVFGKALLTNPHLFICDEPTQAVDIMTRHDIHLFLQEQAQLGKGIIFICSDLQEVLEISDRIILFSEGQTIANLKNENLTTHDILEICYEHQKGEQVSE